MIKSVNKIMSAFVVCLTLPLMACQLDIRDKDTQASEAQKSSSAVQFLSTPAWKLNSVLVLEQDTEIEAQEIELGPQAVIQTHGYSLRLRARVFKSEQALIRTFNEGDEFYSWDHRSPKAITILVEEAHGFLKIENRGLHGRKGTSFDSHHWPDLGEAERGPTAIVGDKFLGMTRKMGEMGERRVLYCVKSNKGTDATVRGADALPGGDGEDGGSTAPVLLEQTNGGSLLVRIDSIVGKGGLGGRPSLPQAGQRGGPAGPDVEGICKGQRGRDAGSGREASEGLRGLDGRESEIQLNNIKRI